MQDEKSKAARKWVDSLPLAVKKVSLDEFKAMYPKGDDMQDRIKELAIEAGIDLDPHQGIARAYPVNLERFAQAIARECIAAAFDAETDRARGDLSGEAVAQAIRARFGIAGER